MGNVINAFEKEKIFTLAEANALLPLIIRITEKHRGVVESTMDKLDQHQYSTGEEHPNTFLMEAEVDWHISDWVGAMERLGAKTKGLWMVDFDNGNGYFCWRYPESKINTFTRTVMASQAVKGLKMDKFEILEIELQKINLEPGDVLSAKLIGDEMDPETMSSLQDHLKKVFPNNKVMVFMMPKDSDIQFTKFTQAPPPKLATAHFRQAIAMTAPAVKKKQ